MTYLGLDEPLGSLNLGLTESPSVLGTHICPYCQVGGFLQSLRGGKWSRWIQSPFHIFIHFLAQVCSRSQDRITYIQASHRLGQRRKKTHPAKWFIHGKHIPSVMGIGKQVSEGANKNGTSLPLWWLQRRSYPENISSCVITGCLSSLFPPASRADLQRVEYTEKTDFLCEAEDRWCLWLCVV